MPVVLFELHRPEMNRPRIRPLGVPAILYGQMPLPAVKLTISGVTRDSSLAPLGNAAVALYRTADDRMMERVQSDGSGNFTVSTVGPGLTYYLVGYKTGSPDVEGTTVNTLTGTAA